MSSVSGLPDTLAQALLTPNGKGRPFLVLYDYVESGTTERFGFLCHAESARDAAETFWNQHPGPWFQLISVNDGTTELFWVKQLGTFVTIPQGEHDENN